MPRIHQLPHSVITKIAAGEVIERPASVVKELLENALDAGAKRIDVEVDQGGVELIRIVDDGCGIEPEDLPLAFASHATSKLTTAEDLFQVATLGFRGEALASIGGVGQVTLQSRPHEREHGAEVFCNGAELSAVRAWNGSPGTRIEVRHLFYNTPVRRKFLRTITTEMGHVCEAFTRLALAQPDRHLTLRHNGKDVYEVPGTADLRERLGLFFGAEVRDQLYALDTTQGPARLFGFVADPACNRGNAKMQYLFLNGRWIRDRSLGHALQEGYRGLIMTGRYPVAFLFLEMAPDQVDVNVHPAKAEVRFRDAQALYHLVLTGVRERLRKENLTARLQPPPAQPTAPWSLSPPPQPGPRLPFSPPQPIPMPLPLPLPNSGSNENSGTGTGTGMGTEVDDLETPVEFPEPTPSRAIQLHDAYLVLETPDGMLVIDQHALHERILYEQFKDRLATGTLERQRLLIPLPIDLPADQAALVLEHREALAELGLEVEDFGGGTVLLTAYPVLLGHRPPSSVLRVAVDHLVAKDRPPSRDHLLNNLLSLMACHAAVRAGDRLTPEEIAALVAQKDLALDTHHCPHGRPTSLLFSRQELDRQFRRT